MFDTHLQPTLLDESPSGFDPAHYFDVDLGPVQAVLGDGSCELPDSAGWTFPTLTALTGPALPDWFGVTNTDDPVVLDIVETGLAASMLDAARGDIDALRATWDALMPRLVAYFHHRAISQPADCAVQVVARAVDVAADPSFGIGSRTASDAQAMGWTWSIARALIVERAQHTAYVAEGPVVAGRGVGRWSIDPSYRTRRDAGTGTGAEAAAAVRALGRIPCAVVYMHYSLVLDCDDIADALAIGDDTVRMHLRRARHELSRELGLDERDLRATMQRATFEMLPAQVPPLDPSLFGWLQPTPASAPSASDPTEVLTVAPVRRARLLSPVTLAVIVAVGLAVAVLAAGYAARNSEPTAPVPGTSGDDLVLELARIGQGADPLAGAEQRPSATRGTPRVRRANPATRRERADATAPAPAPAPRAPRASTPSTAPTPPPATPPTLRPTRPTPPLAQRPSETPTPSNPPVSQPPASGGDLPDAIDDPPSAVLPTPAPPTGSEPAPAVSPAPAG
jgi:DNA-directed RNA polymerase specialized sigma24 family protein